MNDNSHLLQLCLVINHVYFQLCIYIKQLSEDDQKKILRIYHKIFILLKIFNETKSNIIITYFLYNSIKIIENKLLEFNLVNTHLFSSGSFKILINAVVSYTKNYMKLCELMDAKELMVLSEITICPNILKSITYSKVSLFLQSEYYYEYNWNYYFHNYLYTEWRNYLTCEIIEELDIYPSFNGEPTECEYCKETSLCCKLLLVDKDTCFSCSKLWSNKLYLKMKDVLFETKQSNFDDNNDFTHLFRKKWSPEKKLVYKNWNNYFINNINTIIKLGIVPSKTTVNTCTGCNKYTQCCKFLKLKIAESYYCLTCVKKKMIFNYSE